MVGAMMLMFTTGCAFVDAVFEACSAFSLVVIRWASASAGNPASLFILSAEMIVGATGPLTIAYSISRPMAPRTYSLSAGKHYRWLIGHSIGAQQSDIERTIIMAAKPSGNKSVLVIGLGRFGGSVAATLDQMGQDVLRSGQEPGACGPLVRASAPFRPI